MVKWNQTYTRGDAAMLQMKTQMSKESQLDYYYSGSSLCKPGHSHGPALRDNYLIHYIHSGKGTFETEGTTYTLEEKCGFLISPGVRIFYKADDVEPWSYTWVAFKGDMVDQYLHEAGLSKENPVFRYDTGQLLEECLLDILKTKNESTAGMKVKRTGLIYILFSLLISSNQQEFRLKPSYGKNRMEEYIEQALEYMYKNYAFNIKIEEVAKYVSINRRYLSRIFMKHLNKAPHEMLTQIRIRKACELMLNPNLSIGDISRSVGYEDSLQFSKVFKKVHGTSPLKYRRDLEVL
jgi:AraC-like DNA-binding protein